MSFGSESKPQLRSVMEKEFFQMVMRIRRVPPRQEVQKIKLMSDQTRTLVDNPVRNLKCPRGKVCCVWPLSHILDDINSRQQQFRRSVGFEVFICGVCRSQKRSNSDRYYNDFYFDRELDYLMRLARKRYFEEVDKNVLNSQQGKSMRPKKILKHFEESELELYPNGGVIFEYQLPKQAVDHEQKKMTLKMRMILRENVSPTQSSQLIFNPRDFHNAASLKIVQNLAQQTWGQKFERSVEEIKGCYEQHYLEKTLKEVKALVNQSFEGNITLGQEPLDFSARLSVLSSTDSNKTIQLALFFPHSKLFQVYSIGPQKKELYKLINPETAKMAKLKNAVLIFTRQSTIRVGIQTNLTKLKNIQRSEHAYTPAIGLMKKGEGDDKDQWVPEQSVQLEQKTHVKFSKQVSFMQESIKAEVITSNIHAVKQIVKPIIYVDPNDQSNVFLLSGHVDNKPNKIIYKLIERKEEDKIELVWKAQEDKIELKEFQPCVIMEDTKGFLLAKIGQEKPKRQLWQLKVKEEQLRLQYVPNQEVIKEVMNSTAIFPLRMKPNQILLSDMHRREKSQILTFGEDKLTLARLEGKEDDWWKRFWGSIADQRTTQSNFQNAVYSRSSTSQVNYYLVSSNLYQNRYKVLYGCGKYWQASQVAKTLINDKDSQL